MLQFRWARGKQGHVQCCQAHPHLVPITNSAHKSLLASRSAGMQLARHTAAAADGTAELQSVITQPVGTCNVLLFSPTNAAATRDVPECQYCATYH